MTPEERRQRRLLGALKTARDGKPVPHALYRDKRLASLPIDLPREPADIDDELEGLDR